MNDVTRMLEAIRHGEEGAEGRLLPLVYEELRRLAAHRMAGELPGHTLQATALVHEAWLRLAGGPAEGWSNRAHFFTAAAEAMRRILVDHARRKLARKRGAGAEKVEFEESRFALNVAPDELLAVHEALDRLQEEDSQAAELVKLRYFVGMTMQEAADSLALPLRSAERLWTYARLWLRTELGTRSGA
ncbi:MAG: sigma-70 family RNA polymerase sigma factor [Verrucomicrobiae bacterium]|nr:sigma-70 family RNA polymerase sigma factor [Verrucomicrobiae bacterium]